MVPSSIAGTLALYVMGLMAFVLVVPDLVQFAGRVSRKHVVLSATIALVIAGMLGSVYAITPSMMSFPIHRTATGMNERTMRSARIAAV